MNFCYSIPYKDQMPDMHGKGSWFVLFYLEIVPRNRLAFCIQAVQSEICHNKVAETCIFREMHNFVTFVYPANNASKPKFLCNGHKSWKQGLWQLISGPWLGWSSWRCWLNTINVEWARKSSENDLCNLISYLSFQQRFLNLIKFISILPLLSFSVRSSLVEMLWKEKVY